MVTLNDIDFSYNLMAHNTATVTIGLKKTVTMIKSVISTIILHILYEILLFCCKSITI